MVGDGLSVSLSPHYPMTLSPYLILPGNQIGVDPARRSVIVDGDIAALRSLSCQGEARSLGYDQNRLGIHAGTAAQHQWRQYDASLAGGRGGRRRGCRRWH